ncbi:MAG: hypothetical protein IH624_05065 [Phycisphaerae bacterium]|nr:hypothetical protein [Phycisphaerae bacterium]
MRFWRVLLFTFVGAASGGAAAADLGWVRGYAHRVAIRVEAGGFARVDRPVEVDLAEVVRRYEKAAFGGIAVFERRGERLAPLPFQFDADGGVLTFVMDGATAAGAVRQFDVYFGRGDAGGEEGPAVLKHVSVELVEAHEGQAAFCIRGRNATYYYHKLGAGFASMEDRDGQDWLGYNPGVGAESKSGSGGKYRGTPNMGHPEGYCHPGNAVSDSRVVAAGPIRATLESRSNDGKMHCRWDIFANWARMTVLKMRLPYWFLYEGTPGGKLDMETDACIRVDGDGVLVTAAGEKWQGDLRGADGLEWVAFADRKAGRSLVVVHHRDDDAVDSYWPMNGEMTVFGFGRLGLEKFIMQVGAQFTVGLVDSTDAGEIRAVVNNACQPLEIVVGPVENRPTGD